MRAGRFLAAIATLLLLAGRPVQAGPTLLFDAADGKVLYAEDIDDLWHPASLTKMMTAYVTFAAIERGKLKLDQVIACSDNAFQQPPSKLGLAIGGTITVEQALQVLIVKSANDVAVMLGEAVAGNQEAFVAEMNATAKRLGMTRTHFSNPNGLPAPDQVTTARDLGKLARAISHDYPGYAAYWAMPAVRLGKLYMRTHNGLLKSFEGADGMKTGFICDSGFNVVGSATREGRKLMAVVLGERSSPERTLRAASLLEHGFQQGGWKQLFNLKTIDNMPMAEAKGVVSVREQVTSWDCGRQVRLAARQAKAKARAEAKAKAKLAAKPATPELAKTEPAKTEKAPVAAKPAKAAPNETAAVKAATGGAVAKPVSIPASKPKPVKLETAPAGAPSTAKALASGTSPAAVTVPKPAGAGTASAGAALPDAMKPKASAKPAPMPAALAEDSVSP